MKKIIEHWVDILFIAVIASILLFCLVLTVDVISFLSENLDHVTGCREACQLEDMGSRTPTIDTCVCTPLLEDGEFILETAETVK